MFDLVKAEESDRRSLVNGVLFPDMAWACRTNFRYEGVDYTVENGKLYNDKHEVAVLYSPGYGGDYSSYKDVDPTDARAALINLLKVTTLVSGLVKDDPDFVIGYKPGKFTMYPNDRQPSYWDLAIAWLPAGTLFKIDEYDGFESVETAADVKWRIA